MILHSTHQITINCGNCHDNAVAESFFNLLKRERIRRRTYKTRVAARQDVFDYIEMFYNPKRKHVRNGMLSPVQFERQRKMRPEGVYESRGYSALERACHHMPNSPIGKVLQRAASLAAFSALTG